MSQATTNRNKPRDERERTAYEEGVKDGKERDNSVFLIVIATLGFFGMIAVVGAVEAAFAPACQVEASE